MCYVHWVCIIRINTYIFHVHSKMLLYWRFGVTLNFKEFLSDKNNFHFLLLYVLIIWLLILVTSRCVILSFFRHISETLPLLFLLLVYYEQQQFFCNFPVANCIVKNIFALYEYIPILFFIFLYWTFESFCIAYCDYFYMLSY